VPSSNITKHFLSGISNNYEQNHKIKLKIIKTVIMSNSVKENDEKHHKIKPNNNLIIHNM